MEIPPLRAPCGIGSRTSSAEKASRFDQAAPGFFTADIRNDDAASDRYLEKTFRIGSKLHIQATDHNSLHQH